MVRTSKFSASFIGVITAIVVSGCDDNLSNSSSSSPVPEKKWIRVSHLNAIADDYGMNITGKMENISGRRLRRVFIKFSIFDNSDAKIGETADFISELDPGETWKFKAGTFKHGSYRLDSITSSDGILPADYISPEDERRADSELEEFNNKLIQAADASRREESAKAEAARRLVMATNVFKFNLTQAQAGMPSSQYRVAELYLLGQGTETNIEQARFWLYRAATNGDPRAAAKLQALKP